MEEVDSKDENSWADDERFSDALFELSRKYKKGGKINLPNKQADLNRRLTQPHEPKSGRPFY